MFGVSDMLKILDAIPVWRALKGLPARVEAMERLMVVLAGLVWAGAAVAQDRRSPMVQHAWAGYVAAAAPACGLHDSAWGEALLRGLVTDAIRSPGRWGIGISRVMGMEYPESGGLSRAVGGIALARALGERLHAQLPAPVCAEMRRVVSTVTEVVRTANAANTVPSLDETSTAVGRVTFVAVLAADFCRLRRAPWLQDALPVILAPLQSIEAPPPAQARSRRNHLATIDGSQAMALESPRIAHRIYGATLCRSLPQWAELQAADAAAAEGRTARSRPGGIWQDIIPNETPHR